MCTMVWRFIYPADLGQVPGALLVGALAAALRWVIHTLQLNEPYSPYLVRGTRLPGLHHH